ncbi:hypothetical protein IW492_02110 [Enterococcus sp. BWB1-3]|nr:hypothetical protein [Enterococcus sp. BWB1-3]
MVILLILILVLIAWIGYTMFKNAKSVVITIEKNGLKTDIKAPNIEFVKMNEIYQAIFEGIQEYI